MEIQSHSKTKDIFKRNSGKQLSPFPVCNNNGSLIKYKHHNKITCCKYYVTMHSTTKKTGHNTHIKHVNTTLKQAAEYKLLRQYTVTDAPPPSKKKQQTNKQTTQL